MLHSNVTQVHMITHHYKHAHIIAHHDDIVQTLSKHHCTMFNIVI